MCFGVKLQIVNINMPRKVHLIVYTVLTHFYYFVTINNPSVPIKNIYLRATLYGKKNQYPMKKRDQQ